MILLPYNKIVWKNIGKTSKLKIEFELDFKLKINKIMITLKKIKAKYK